MRLATSCGALSEPIVADGVFPDSLVSYVEEDQEAQGAHAPLKGQPRQASKHGSRLSRSPHDPPRFIACGRHP